MFCQVLKTNGDLCLGTSACFLVPFTHIVVCVKGQEPPSRELIKLELWVNTRQSAELWQKDSHSSSVERFFSPFKEHFSLWITSHRTGLTYSLTLVVIRANHWSWEGGFLHLKQNHSRPTIS